uniref:Retrotransposon protein, putative, Ty1-copia subclass n=1 Tax=Tanacetum cinerariifolium TaxID=118510 RepID=A0A699HV57_TANCI|nr:hypothetical protein [Tanacetum cinerariifolium]
MSSPNHTFNIEDAFSLNFLDFIPASPDYVPASPGKNIPAPLTHLAMENSKKGCTSMIEEPDYRKSQGVETPNEQNPGEIYWTDVKTILKYLKNTKEMVLVYEAKPEAELEVPCYADASFQTDKDDTKSQTGYVFMLNGGVVNWKSAKQSTTAMSSI